MAQGLQHWRHTGLVTAVFTPGARLRSETQNQRFLSWGNVYFEIDCSISLEKKESIYRKCMMWTYVANQTVVSALSPCLSLVLLMRGPS